MVTHQEFLPGEFYGQRSLVCYSYMGLHVGCKELGLQRVGHDLLTEQQQICTFTSFAL